MQFHRSLRIFMWGLMLSGGALLGIFLALGSTPVRAAPAAGIIRVTVTGTMAWPCGSTWSTSCALSTAMTNSVSGDELWLAAGTYTPTVGVTRAVTFRMKAGVALYGGFSGTEAARAERNWTTHVVTLSCDLAGNDGPGFTNYEENCYTVVTGANNALLDGVTVIGGNSTGDYHFFGAGMVNSMVSSGVANVIFRDNRAVSGGGMSNLFNGSPVLTNVLFFNNVATTQDGGGMYTQSGQPRLTDVSFISNSAHLNGGGMANQQGGNPILLNVVFMSNTASFAGGGMSNYLQNYPSLTQVLFQGNSALYGGAVNDYKSNLPQFNQVAFRDNFAEQGGAIYFQESGGIFNNVTFNGNYATRSMGALQTYQSAVTMTNVTFSGNRVPYSGGAIGASYGSFLLTNVTFSDNQAGEGGALNVTNLILEIRNSILWGDSGGEITGSGNSITVTHSIVQGGYPGVGNRSADPVLGALGNYGGSTAVRPLLPGSAAIDGCSSDCPATDQRGVARGPLCDLGAYESRGFTMTYGSGALQTASLMAAFPLPLQVGVTGAYTDAVDGGVVTFVGPLTGAGIQPITHTARISGGVAAQVVTANSTLGSYNVMAGLTGTTHVTFALTNVKTTPTVVVTSTANPALYGQPLTFTVGVTALSGVGTGSITLTIDATAIPLSLDGEGRAGYVTSTLGVGTHAVTASYSGDESFNPASGVLSGGQTVNEVPITGLSVRGPAQASLVAPALFTATVSSGSPMTYQWAFGDGSLGAGNPVSHQYQTVGNYTVTVTARNGLEIFTATTTLPVQGMKLFLPLVMKL